MRPTPLRLDDEDFRKAMVAARETIVARCMGDNRMRRTLKVALEVSPAGGVEKSKVVGELGETTLGKCVAKQAKKIEFPVSIHGGEHTYTLHLR
ncbi:MAG: hypothetical protein HC927_09525 [Deltaproteobacteria bacterium]|nr:hypothetical protein [Deltaproteobacteria bacterium]